MSPLLTSLSLAGLESSLCVRLAHLAETQLSSGVRDLSSGGSSPATERAHYIVTTISIAVEILVWAVQEDAGVCQLVSLTSVSSNCMAIARFWTMTVIDKTKFLLHFGNFYFYLSLPIVQELPIAICTVEPLYCGHLGDLVKCPVQRGVLISGVNLQ